VGVRLRALAFLVILTTGDYLLWSWSIANGHDILSLVAGLTLIPLAAVGFAQLILTGGRVTALLLGRSSKATRTEQTSPKTNSREHPGRNSSAQADPSSGKLAA
jgi:hypothetical protein